jgi:hypothetical protein
LNLRLATKFLSRKGTAVPIKKAKDILRYLYLQLFSRHPSYKLGITDRK